MNNLFNPRWILVLTTIPSIILAFLSFRSYTIIESLLDSSSLHIWSVFAILFALLTLGTLGYAIWSYKKDKDVTIIYSLITLILYTIFLYGYSVNAGQLIPWDIPRWLVPESLTHYLGSFLMPTLLYSLIIAVRWSIDNREHKNPFLNLVYAISIPFSFYIFINIIVPFWQPIGSDFLNHVAIIFCVLATILFLFFIIRWIYLLTHNKGIWSKNQFAYRVIFGIFFPLLGLALNNGILPGKLDIGDGIFGDFSNYWFYGLAMLNGLFLCLKSEVPKYRLAIFILRSITYTYIVYFFLVFMPYLPLSIIAILLLGLGFLMLSPLLLFSIQTKDLIDDFKFLKKYYSKLKLSFLSIGAMLIIPLVISLSFLQDKTVLTQALDAIYSPDFSKPQDVNIGSLNSTIKQIKQNRKQVDWLFDGSHIPFISSYFSWLVLDNMTLSNDKIRKIENIYFGSSQTYSRSSLSSNSEVTISNIKSSSTYNPKENVWESWIDIEITNNSKRRFAEYGTRINLPTGCWINDYYLYVGEKKEMGMLTEKKSAMWVYSQIRNQNRDPGILNYTSGNEVAFRVFPFATDQTRKTGIKFIHKEPVTIQIDNEEVKLGNYDIIQPSIHTSDQSGSAVYISSEEKSTLPKITLRPYFHFIIDASLGKEHEMLKTITRINTISESYPKLLKNSKVTFTNFKNSTFDFTKDWKSFLESHSFEGGFYLESAIKTILYNSYKSKDWTSPRIVVLSNNLESSIIEKNFSNFKIAFPENDLFYTVNSENSLVAHSLLKSPKTSLELQEPDLEGHAVYCWPDAVQPKAFLPIDANPSIALSDSDTKIDKLSNNPWDGALQLHGQWLHQCLHPELSIERWLDIVKGSFKSRVLTPHTAFIVVENEAQKAMLLRKQEQVLKGNKNLDLNQDTQQMSEPSIWIFVVLLLIFLLYKHRSMVNMSLR